MSKLIEYYFWWGHAFLVIIGFNLQEEYFIILEKAVNVTYFEQIKDIGRA